MRDTIPPCDARAVVTAVLLCLQLNKRCGRLRDQKRVAAAVAVRRVGAASKMRR